MKARADIEIPTRRLELIYIAGVTPRAGTNFLARILLKHPSTCRPVGHWELPLLEVGNRFQEFYDAFSACRQLGRLGFTFDEFARAFGDGFRSLLEARVQERGPDARFLVHKNPGTRGIDLFPAFFPDQKLIFLVRDGRDVVHSWLAAAGHKDGGFSPKRWARLAQFARRWNESARRIIDYRRSVPDSSLLIRFEDLHQDSAGQLDQLAGYLGAPLLPDWLREVTGMSIQGSSFYHMSETAERPGRSTWDGVGQTQGFQPIGRWRKSWSRLERALFEMEARKALRFFGYE